MTDKKKLALILSQAEGQLSVLSTITTPLVEATPVDICVKLVVELQAEVPEIDIGQPTIHNPGTSRKYAERADVMAKLSQVVSIAEVMLGLTKHVISKKKVKVFIGHGKKKNPLELLRRFIEGLGLEALIAQEKASKGGSINKTVETYMSMSDCVILLSTADVKAKDGMHSNENVINEEGLAKKYVGDKIIYLLDKEVDVIPSNYKEKVYETFDDDNMTAAFIKVVKELSAFQLI
ncbi:TIR domain-containing protein [Candidatus Margulisiibacteriota bacterium]